MPNTFLSANQANSLFWLGRYAERGYLMLHLMRRAYDEVIDVPVGEVPYSDFLAKINGFATSNLTTSYQMMKQIYDPETTTSLRSIIERMMDNAITLRAQIYSESFSYIELCRNLIREKAALQETNITALQPITDWLLAFWGSIRERVHGRTYSLLEVGRLVERIDMFVRFDYKHVRVEETWQTLRGYIATEGVLFDHVQAERLGTLLADAAAFDAHDATYKDNLLSALNCLVMV